MKATLKTSMDFKNKGLFLVHATRSLLVHWGALLHAVLQDPGTIWNVAWAEWRREKQLNVLPGETHIFSVHNSLCNISHMATAKHKGGQNCNHNEPGRWSAGNRLTKCINDWQNLPFCQQIAMYSFFQRQNELPSPKRKTYKSHSVKTSSSSSIISQWCTPVNREVWLFLICKHINQTASYCSSYIHPMYKL